MKPAARREKGRKSRKNQNKRNTDVFDEWLEDDESDTPFDVEAADFEGPYLSSDPGEKYPRISTKRAIESALEELALRRELEDFPESEWIH